MLAYSLDSNDGSTQKSCAGASTLTMSAAVSDEWHAPSSVSSVKNVSTPCARCSA